MSFDVVGGSREYRKTQRLQEIREYMKNHKDTTFQQLVKYIIQHYKLGRPSARDYALAVWEPS